MRKIIDFENYKISKNGKVYKKDKLITPIINKVIKKYIIRLTRDGIRHTKYIHNLVYESYIGEIPKDHYIKFKDGDINNLNYKNLALTTKEKELKDKNDSIILDESKKWKTIKKYNDYKISDHGDVYSSKKCRILKPSQTGGYYRVTLINNDNQKCFAVHRLVYQMFGGKLKEDLVIDHIDRNTTNNYINNLRQVTLSQNSSNVSEDSRNKFKYEIHQYDMDGDFIKKWKNIYEIVKNNEMMKADMINAACSGRKKSAYGFIWKSSEYIEDNLDDYTVLDKIDGSTYSNYKINRNGVIINNSNRILRPATISGYKCIGLTSDKGKQRTLRVHRLVAIKFIENPNDHPVVNHIDRNRSNNNSDNLEWTTSKANTIHACGKKVNQIDVKTDEIINTYNSMTEAYTAVTKRNSGKCNISRACKGERKTAYGYKWEFVE